MTKINCSILSEINMLKVEDRAEQFFLQKNYKRIYYILKCTNFYVDPSKFIYIQCVFMGQLLESLSNGN